MDKGSLAYFKDKAEKGARLVAKIEYCEKALTNIEKNGMGFVSIFISDIRRNIDFTTNGSPIGIQGQDSVDCYGEIALQVIKDLRDRYQAEFDAL